MNEIQQKVIEIMRQNTSVEGMKDEELLAGDFTGIGINSLNFIKIVVAVEETFGLEFNDDDLNYEAFKNIQDITDLVEKTVQAKEMAMA